MSPHSTFVYVLLRGITYLVPPSPVFPINRSQPKIQPFRHGTTAGKSLGQPWKPPTDMTDQHPLESCTLRAVSGLERNKGAIASGAASDQSRVSAGGSRPPPPGPFEEVPDTLQTFRGSPEELGPSCPRGSHSLIHFLLVFFFSCLLKVLSRIISEVNHLHPNLYRRVCV